MPKPSDEALTYLLYLLRGVRFAGTLTENPYLASVGLEGGFLSRGWKAVADNFLLRVEGDGLSHATLREAIADMAAPAFWTAPETRKALLGKLPGYRLSKFQDCLPERFALEVIERYLLEVDGTVKWLGEGAPA